MRPLIVSVLVAALPLLSSPAAKADLPVDLELVLAVDVSGSVDEEEAKLQRAGYIDALLNPKVIGAIRSGPLGRIAVAYMEWAGDHYQRVTVGWTLLDGPAAAQSFVGSLEEAPLRTAQWTSISAAIDHAAGLFEGNGFEGTRRVIDVSGDGVNNRGRPVQDARDAALAAGITINGLPILNDRPNPWGGPTTPNLDVYYRDNVIGGPGAFLVPAVNFESFSDAILSKLLLEIAGIGAGTVYAGR